MEQLERIDAQMYLYRLGHSKTDPAGTGANADAVKPVVGAPPPRRSPPGSPPRG